MNTRSRSARTDMSKSEMRSVAYRKKMKSIGAIDVKNALLKSRIQKSCDPFERTSASTTNRVSEVTNGLRTVEMIFATSVHTRLRIRSGVGVAEGRFVPESGTCTGTGLRARS